MKNKIKIILHFLIILLIIISVNTKIYAADFSIKNIMSEATNFINNGTIEDTTISEDSIKSVSDFIYNILLILGTIAAVIYGMVLGLKFITGSLEEKANIKESLYPYIIGCVILFGAFAIWQLILKILEPMQ